MLPAAAAGINGSQGFTSLRSARTAAHTAGPRNAPIGKGCGRDHEVLQRSSGGLGRAQVDNTKGKDKGRAE